MVAKDGKKVRRAARIWEHTVYELENIACALWLVSKGELDSPPPQRSIDCLIGPVVNLKSAIWQGIGNPDLGCGSSRALVYCGSRYDPVGAKRIVVDVAVVWDGIGRAAVMEVEDASALSDAFYELAKFLAPKFVE